MDDFVISNLNESRNEWCSRLVGIFTPLIVDGVRSIFDEAWKMCVTNEEVNKYLMTFQNLLSRIPKWNNTIVEEERKRIIDRSGCNYLEDLITCVHIIQLKILTCIRVGNKQKKIDINIPSIDSFIHKVYILVARKVYTNVYLFEKNVTPLQLQKNNRELEMIVQECIMNTIRESIPTEAIIRAYMDESVEQDEEVYIEAIEEPEEKKEEEDKKEPASTLDIETQKEEHLEKVLTKLDEEEPPSMIQTVQDIDPDEKVTSTTLSFNDIDSVLDETNNIKKVDAPKSLEKLEEISNARAFEQRMEESDDDSDYDDLPPLKIDTSQDLTFDDFDVLESDAIKKLDNTKEELVLNDVQTLPAF